MQVIGECKSEVTSVDINPLYAYVEFLLVTHPNEENIVNEAIPT